VFAAAATSGRSDTAAKPIPTISAGLPPPPGTPTSDVPRHSVTVPGLARSSAAFREGRAVLRGNRYVGRATGGQRLTIVRADPWTAHDGSLVGVTMVVAIATPVAGARWLPIVSHTDAKNQHVTSNPEGDVYDPK
jgi:hypothetical protein